MWHKQEESIPRILIIDDNTAIHADFKKILCAEESVADDFLDLETSLFGDEGRSRSNKRIQYEIDVALQGQEALELVIKAEKEGRPYALAFVDGRMPPGWDGIETIKHLWQESPTLQTVLCTAYADYSWDEIQASLGETDSLLILKKPFDNVEVMQLCHALTCKWEMARQIEGRLYRLAYYDTLTKLPNRDHFLQYLDRSIRTGRRGAVFFIDLDKFKRINDTFGHHAGDTLLQIVANRLAYCVRRESSERPGTSLSTGILARIGGDEFAVIVDEFTSEEELVAIAERILEKVSRSIELEHRQVMVTPSIGISLYPDNGTEIGDVLKCADLAMYFSKRNGANIWNFYQHWMAGDATQRLSVEVHLREALERREFALHYQPQISVDTREISGFEALLRWQHSELGLVPPMEFIPVAEECGLMVPIGRWVMETACWQGRKWLDEGLNVPRIGVNVSLYQFAQADFLEMVQGILEQTGLPPGYLQIEITESLLLKKELNIQKILSGLHEMGVQIAIDDFGTGYSNLNRLRELPIDQLKIDRSFICDIEANIKNRSILTAIIAMAVNMGVEVIAEGVETDEQLAILQGEQCEEVQGFLISRPMDTEKATEYMRKRQQ